MPRRQRSSPPLRARGEALLGVLHRPHPEPEHPPRLPLGRPALRRMVRAPRPRLGPGRADGGRGLRRAAPPERSRRRASSSISRRCGCSSTGSSSARSCPSTPRARSAVPSMSSRPARPRCSPPRRPGRSSTTSTSRRSQAFVTRAFLGVLVYSFARASAAVSLRVADYYTQGPRSFFPAPREGRAVQRSSPPTIRPRNTSTPTSRPARIGEDPPRAPLPELRARAARCPPGPGDVALECAQDDQAPRPKGGTPPPRSAPTASAAPGSPSTCETGGNLEVAARIAGHESTRTTPALQSPAGRDLAG